MNISGFFTITRHTARLSVKLFMGIWILSCVPGLAQTPNRAEFPVLIAQNQRLLREGDQGIAIRELQIQLHSNGLFPARINGFYGPETTQAVRQFQQIRRLNVTGIADLATLNELGIDLTQLPIGLSHPIYGAISGDSVTSTSSIADVRILQQVLRSFGFNLSTDGIYGPQTIQAVRAYERTAGLQVNGIADQTTLMHMGFTSGGFNATGTRVNNRTRVPRISGGDSSRSSQGRYVAAIIAGPSEFNNVRQDFPNATLESNNVGEYISIGRFEDLDEADEWADFASNLGYEARVLRN